MVALTPTVLVVDNERPLVQLVRSYLEREQFRVVEAFDGRQALDAARTQAPDVIVLDLMLPGVDGLEVAREIRTFSDAYIIMLTARADEVDRIVGLSVGADDYLTKPFSVHPPPLRHGPRQPPTPPVRSDAPGADQPQ